MKLNKILLIAFASMFTLTINYSIANQYEDNYNDVDDSSIGQAAPGQGDPNDPQDMKAQYKEQKAQYKNNKRQLKNQQKGLKVQNKIAKKQTKLHRRSAKLQRKLNNQNLPPFNQNQNFPPQDMQYAGSRSNFN